MRHLVFITLSLACLALAGCGDTDGAACDDNGDCDGNQVCAPRVDACSDPGGCFGVCGKPCESDEDCSGDRICERSAEPGIAICRVSRAPG